jgi:hypothetical protein
MRWISSSLLALTLAACASTTSSAWVVRGSTPVVQGGGGAISEGQMKFESAPIATGRARSNIYEFDFQTRVPLTGFDFQLLDESGQPVPEGEGTVIRRIGVETDVVWTANVAVGFPTGTLQSNDIPPGPFRVYLDTITDRPQLRFVMTFRRK